MSSNSEYYEEQERRDLDAVAAFHALPDHVTLEQANDFLCRWHDSYTRMAAVVSLRQIMDDDDWLTLLGQSWPICDTVGRYVDHLFDALGERGPLLSMMDAEEQAMHGTLPDRITVYRGCDRQYVYGASWSLDKQTAERFPFLARYRADDPVLVTGLVQKQHVLAVLLGRNEQEIVSFNVQHVKVEPLQKRKTGADV